MSQSLVLFLFLFGFAHVSSASHAAESVTSEKINKLIVHSKIPKSELGIFVIHSTDRSVVYKLNSEQHFIPASISKLMTTGAVLHNFGVNYKFHTQIYADGPIQDGVLNGDLYLKGGGDPAFVSEKMWMLVNDFLRSGIKKVKGALYVDDSFFDAERIDPNREEDRNDRAYDAPISALSFDWNSTTLYARPGEKAGDLAQAWVDPINDYVTLKSEIKTASSGGDFQVSRLEGVEGKDILVARGKIAVDSTEKHSYKNISDPALYAGYNLKEFLKQRGVTFDKDIGVKTTPSQAKVVADLEGDPIGKLITDMNKFSNNFIAEMLAKNLGAYKTGHQGKMSDGLQVVRDFLTGTIGFSEKDFKIVNVSGFTRRNSFTPEQFTQLLFWFKNQFDIFPEFQQSLPIAGVDGTLHKRMLNSPAQGWVRAKTGLLNGVVALSGYIGKKNESPLIFAFIYNGHHDESRVRDLFDSIAESLAQ